MTLRKVFVDHLVDTARVKDVPPEYLDGVIRAAVRKGRARWPAIGLEEEAFVASLAERTPDGPLLEAIRLLHHTDLFLACACCRGDADALAAFEEDFMPEVNRVSGRTPGLSSDVLRQAMRERLFVHSANRNARIVTYRGTGDLKHWLRVVAMRTALEIAEGGGEERQDEDVLRQAVDAAD